MKLRASSILFLVLYLLSCGTPVSNENNAKSITIPELQKKAVKTAATVSPKDTVTQPEEGGYGFENIATKLGYKTHQVPQNELKYFGDSRAVKGGILSLVQGQFPATLRTEGKNSIYYINKQIRSMVYETLLDLHPVTSDYIPGLATHWKISHDKMSFWFRLNPDARFSDGHAVTAGDVITSYNLLMDETILSPSAQLTFSKFKRPVAETKYIVKVECKSLNWRNFHYFSSALYIYPAFYLQSLSGIEYLREYNAKMLPGTGPYTILTQDIKNQISFAFTRRLDYWDCANPLKRNMNNFDKIKQSVVKDNPLLLFEKFKKGDYDFTVIGSARDWHGNCNFNAVQKGWIQKRKIYSQRPSGWAGYAFNMRIPPFNDRRIRSAFSYLLYRERMNHELFYDEYILQNSLYAGSIYENPDNEKITYDPVKAVKLLAEAGWKDRNKNGWLINDKGEEFRETIRIPKYLEYVVTPYQQSLKKYGIDLQIQFMDRNALWKIIMERNFSICYEFHSGTRFPNPEDSLHSSLADKNNTKNIYGFKNSRVDELLILYDREFDSKVRQNIIREIDGIVTHERILVLTHYYPYHRVLYWDKFGYPDYMFSRYGDKTILNYWWLDPQKIGHLKESMKKDRSLPKSEMLVTYWLNFNSFR